MDLRHKIKEEASILFFKSGIRKVTMEDIAIKMGISKRTIYETIKNKDELISICLQGLSENYKKRHLEIKANSANVIEHIITAMKKGIIEFTSINPLFFKDLKKYYPEHYAKFFIEQSDKIYTGIYNNLSDGMEEGIFRQDIEKKIVAEIFLVQLITVSNKNRFNDQKYNYPDVIQNLIINFLRGISTQKGIATIDRMVA